AGSYFDAAAVQHGFLLDRGTFTMIDVPGATRMEALGINDRGEIVGNYTDGGGDTHGFLPSGGAFSPVHFPGATTTLAVGSNARGVPRSGWARCWDDGPNHCPR